MNTENVGLVLIVLLAVLVGVSLPVLLQLHRTLREIEKTFHRSGARLDEALTKTGAAVGRIDAVVGRLESGGSIERFLEGVASLTATLGQMREATSVMSALGAAVGPAVVAAIRSFREEPAPPRENVRQSPPPVVSLKATS